MKPVLLTFALIIVGLPAAAQVTQSTCTQYGNTINCNTYGNSAPPAQPVYQPQPGPLQSFIDGFQRTQSNIAQTRAVQAQTELIQAQTDAIRQQTRSLEVERQRAAAAARQDDAQRRAASEAATASAIERADAKGTAAIQAKHEAISDLTNDTLNLESRCLTSLDASTCGAADAYRSELQSRQLK